jgi:hypothetical protein
MNENDNRTGSLLLSWASIALLGFVLLVISSVARGGDVYDITQGERAIREQPALLTGAHITFAWSGVALIFMIVALHGRLIAGSHTYFANVAAIFGLIAGALYLFYGLVGGFGYYELYYVQSVHSAGAISGAYLPLSIISNRTLAASISVLGVWFLLINWIAVQSQLWPKPIAYLGAITGAIALLGFLLPGGGFGILSLLLGAIWGILTGINLLQSKISGPAPT